MWKITCKKCGREQLMKQEYLKDTTIPNRIKHKCTRCGNSERNCKEIRNNINKSKKWYKESNNVEFKTQYEQLQEELNTIGFEYISENKFIIKGKIYTDLNIF